MKIANRFGGENCDARTCETKFMQNYYIEFLLQRQNTQLQLQRQIQNYTFFIELLHFNIKRIGVFLIWFRKKFENW